MSQIGTNMQSASSFLEFVNRTGSPFPTSLELQRILETAGFVRLEETKPWEVKVGGKYFVTRNSSTIAAFNIGEDFVKQTETRGFVIVAAHTDSPCLRLRPNSNITSEQYCELGVECYGGGLWHTWFDRGLGLAGKVVAKNGGGVSEKLVRISRPVCIIPNLAIHLQTAEERAAFKFNKETHLRPILCSTVTQQLLAAGNSDDKGCDDNETIRMPSPLLKLLAQEVDCKEMDIVDADLCLMDATPSRLCGIFDEFVESPRLDNLVSCWAAFDAITMKSSPCDIQVAVAFDHEECGSLSWVGGDSSILKDWMERIVASLGLNTEDGSMQPIFARSCFVSADMAHGVHPNYPEKHQAQHKPMINCGIVIKYNTNQRYATAAYSAALCRAVSDKHSTPIPIQRFVVRNDSLCGSTIGPMSASRLGMKTVDLGVAQFAMHSCRELSGIFDLDHLRNFFIAFYQHFRAVYAQSAILD